MMKKISGILAVFLSIGFYSSVIAQTPESKEKKEVIVKRFLDAYNQKDYKGMKQDFNFLIKIVLSKKMMRESFSEIYDMWGKFKIVNIAHPSDTKTEVKVASERDPTETETFNFLFSSKEKLTGFFLKGTEFIYPKGETTTELLSTEKAAKIDSIVQAKYDLGNFNGCVLAIDNGQVLYKKCYGYSNFDNKTYLNDSTVFYLASVSKQFTAMGIIMLAEQGKINYSDSIRKYIPELPDEYGNITVKHLLTHTSGLYDYMLLFQKHWDKTKIANNNDVILMFQKYKPKSYFKPGESFSYSNTGYALLASIIERASGMSYHNFLKQYIFIPSGMKDTEVFGVQKGNSESPKNYAYGYVYSDSLDRYIKADSLPKNNYTIYLDEIVGDGNVNSTISDFVLWDRTLREHKLISKSMLDTVYSNQKLINGRKINYGYGVFVEDKEGAEKVVHHGGGWPGYHTFMLRFLDTDKTIVILSNNEYISFNQLADKIAKILLSPKE